MIDSENGTDLSAAPQQDGRIILITDPTTVEDENSPQDIILLSPQPPQDSSSTNSKDDEMNSQDCSNRPDPPSIIDGCHEQVPRGDIPANVSTLETNQSLLSEDFSVSDTQKDEHKEPNSPLSQEESTELMQETCTARPSRVARDPSISLPDMIISSSEQDDENEILHAVEQLHARRVAPPVWDDQDEDGLVRKTTIVSDVGLQHVRERLTPSHIELLPSIEERSPRVFLPMQKQQSFDRLPARRRIRLLLQEEMDKRRNESILGHIRRRSSLFRSPVDESQYEQRGHITVSWYDGTSTLELNEHVRSSAMRKLKLESFMEIKDLRFLDETVDPPEEVVLSPFIPDGAQFTLRFALSDTRYDGDLTPEAPESPSAAPSPKPTRLLSNLKEKELSLLRIPSVRRSKIGMSRSWDTYHQTPKNVSTPLATTEEDENQSKKSEKSFEDELPPPDNEDPVEMRLRQITELLLSDQRERNQFQGRRNEKRQVVFTLANYFVLFLSLLAISAEIQARAPAWLHNLEMQRKNVTNCASDKEALFRCVSNGEFAGLIASVIIWLTRNVATRRIFLFGFESPQKLWTVVYEALVTAFSWGFSYLFVRRALNPDTRPRFLRKYWKDAVYGSLAGFNAFFLKQVLKNLIPQEAVEEMVFEPRLKILSWLPSFS